MKKEVKNTLLLGASGREFYNFLKYFKNNGKYKVVGFTAAQIPGIANRIFPAKLAGKLYKRGIKIYDEKHLSYLIKKLNVDIVCLSYSDLSYDEVMHKASIALGNGADFWLLGPKSTMLHSKKTVIAVTAVRTGCGKSQTAKKIATYYKNRGLKVVVIRHPMPYGKLLKQEIQRFENYDDLRKYSCSIEEREEYEPHLKKGIIVYAGVNYEKILKQAEKEADVIVWDGGNNDFPFIKSDLLFTVVDPHRPGHEIMYYPGEVNFRMADVIVINKVDTAKKENIKIIEENIKKFNPKAVVIKAASPLTVVNKQFIKNKRVLVVEDGPTLTHGGMSYGAGTIAAKKYKAKTIVDAKKYAVGSIKKVFGDYKHLKNVLPAMGYSNKQINELKITMNRADCDLVIDGTPFDIKSLIKINKPIINVTYELKEIGKIKLDDVLRRVKIK